LGLYVPGKFFSSILLWWVREMGRGVWLTW
jgi:hypothetical protein